MATAGAYRRPAAIDGGSFAPRNATRLCAEPARATKRLGWKSDIAELAKSNGEPVENAQFLATQARDPGIAYEHSELGYNYRLRNVLAAMGRGQLSVLELRVAQRSANAARDRAAFADLEGFHSMPEALYGRHTNWLSCFRVNQHVLGVSMDEPIAALDVAHVESMPICKPMHLQPTSRSFMTYGGAVAENLFRPAICLLSLSSLSLSDQLYVVNQVRRNAGYPELSTLSQERHITVGSDY
jgi:dTDP-4-amino-4,6-dideoxygalactose transaminase